MTNDKLPPFIWQIEARIKAQTPSSQTVNTYLLSATLVLHTIALVQFTECSIRRKTYIVVWDRNVKQDANSFYSRFNGDGQKTTAAFEAGFRLFSALPTPVRTSLNRSCWFLALHEVFVLWSRLEFVITIESEQQEWLLLV